MRIAVLVKQVPRGEEHQLVDGRLDRTGVELEVNAYCRRANAKAVELAGPDGEVVVFTMGPPSAEDALREMIACGATRGVHISDRLLAGSDTLATSRVLAVAVSVEGPFDLVLCGLNSIDADTGQVGPQVAELLGLPFVAAVRELDLDAQWLRIRSELDNATQVVKLARPAVLSTAERLCDPSKADPPLRAAVAGERIRTVGARALGFRSAETGQAGSPTAVGPPEVAEVERGGTVVPTAAAAVALLEARGAFERPAVTVDPVPATTPSARPEVWCVLDPGHERGRSGLLGEAAVLAAALGGSVTAVVPGLPARDLGPDGADRVRVVPGAHADDWADAVAELIGAERPRIVLVDGTTIGRVVASIAAARYGWGLTGDGIRLDTDPSGALTVWKPALGGRMVVPITSISDVQMATIRPGVLPLRPPRAASAEVVRHIPARRRPDRVRVLETVPADQGRAELAGAHTVIAVGQGVAPEDYGRLDRLRSLLGATFGATRKVTDRGWMPRSRQIGLTGSSLQPRLVVSIGASGRFNHSCGFRAAPNVLAVNIDPDAEIFGQADVGVVGDWREVADALADAIEARRLVRGDADPQRRVSASTGMSPSLET